jgi:SAM-dependent methyltransferase
MHSTSRTEDSRFVNQEAATRSNEAVGFSFGANWQKLVARLDEESVRQATESLSTSFRGEAFNGRRFLDVGSGSGLFSLGALLLGASEIVSIDVDPNSIACVAELKRRQGDPASWTVIRGSVLDGGLVRSLGTADLVFSWGVIHHTGAMWSAFENLTNVVKAQGLLCVAIYNRPRLLRVQLALKRTYNRLPRPFRPALRVAYGGALLALLAVKGRNPMRYVSEYGARSRGMNFWRDVDDWLGGLPFEFASADQVKTFAESHGFRVEAEVLRSPGGCNEYLLRKVA